MSPSPETTATTPNPSLRPGPRIGKLRMTIGALLTAVLVYFLFRVAEPARIAEILSGASFGPLALACLVYASNNVVRTVRFRAAGARGRFGPLYAVSSMNGLLLRIMPFRTGDLAYVFLLKDIGGGSLTTGLAGMVIIRLVDLSLFLLAAVALLATGLLPGGSAGFLSYGVLVLAVLGVVGLYIYLENLIRKGVTMLRRAAVRLQIRIPSRWEEKIEKALAELSRIHNAPARVKATLFFMTFVFWMHIVLLYTCCLWSLGVTLSLKGAILMGIFGLTGAMVPLGVVGTVGFQEAGFALGLVAIGIPAAEAAALGVSVSLLTVVATLTPAVPSGLWLWFRRRHPHG